MADERKVVSASGPPPPGLESANDAVQPPSEVRELFAQLGATPALAETDSRLQEAIRLGG